MNSRMRTLLTSELAGWRMAGPGGFRPLGEDVMESHGGPVLDSPLHRTGAIDRLAPALHRWSRQVGPWNVFEVAARGPRIQVRLNGEEVLVREHGTREQAGHVGLQNHREGSAVQFRNLRVIPVRA